MHPRLSFHGDVTLKSSPHRISEVGMENVGSSVASLQGNSEVFSFYNSTTVPNSSMMKGAEETKQSLQNNNQSNYWTNTDLVKSNVNESLGVLQHHFMNDSQILHSSPDVGDKEFKMYEIENNDKKDNSNDSYHSNSHPHSSAGGVRENALSDASDSRCLLMGKQKLSNQGGLRNSWPPKFQYHPLENLNEDVDPHCSMKQSTCSKFVVQHNSLNGQIKGFWSGSPESGRIRKGNTINSQNVPLVSLLLQESQEPVTLSSSSEDPWQGLALELNAISHPSASSSPSTVLANSFQVIQSDVR